MAEKPPSLDPAEMASPALAPAEVARPTGTVRPPSERDGSGLLYRSSPVPSRPTDEGTGTFRDFRPVSSRPVPVAVRNSPDTQDTAASTATEPKPNGRVLLADLEPHHCRYPFGDPGEVARASAHASNPFSKGGGRFKSLHMHLCEPPGTKTPRFFST
jgi:hypothetical protein